MQILLETLADFGQQMRQVGRLQGDFHNICRNLYARRMQGKTLWVGDKGTLQIMYKMEL